MLLTHLMMIHLPNPTLTLYRGQTYTFTINTVDMPFTIRTTSEISDDNLYNNGFSKQKVEQGQVTFEVLDVLLILH